MSRVEARSEVLKLARVLDTPPERLDFLAEVDPADLRVLRTKATDVLFDANRAVLERMALASRLLPASVLARIAERVFGPLLCARIAGLVDVSRGVDVATRLTHEFLADVAVELDPRRASAIIARIPAATVAAVAEELADRKDWITVGRFVGHLPEDAVASSLGALGDEDLLRVAFVLDDKSRAANVIGLLPPRRYRSVLETADADGLWPNALDLLTHLDEEHRSRFVTAAGQLPADVRARAAATAAELGLPDLS